MSIVLFSGGVTRGTPLASYDFTTQPAGGMSQAAFAAAYPGLAISRGAAAGSSYIQTSQATLVAVGVNDARFADYGYGVEGLALREARTNILTLADSRNFTGGIWTATIGVSAGNPGSPDGTANANIATIPGTGLGALINGTNTLTATSYYSGSVWLKAGTATFLAVSTGLDIGVSFVSGGGPRRLVTGWQKAEFHYGQSESGGNVGYLEVLNNSGAGGPVSTPGTFSADLAILEQAGYAGEWVPGGATCTNDVLTVTNTFVTGGRLAFQVKYKPRGAAYRYIFIPAACCPLFYFDANNQAYIDSNQVLWVVAGGVTTICGKFPNWNGRDSFTLSMSVGGGAPSRIQIQRNGQPPIMLDTTTLVGNLPNGGTFTFFGSASATFGADIEKLSFYTGVAPAIPSIAPTPDVASFVPTDLQSDEWQMGVLGRVQVVPNPAGSGVLLNPYKDAGRPWYNTVFYGSPEEIMMPWFTPAATGSHTFSITAELQALDSAAVLLIGIWDNVAGAYVNTTSCTLTGVATAFTCSAVLTAGKSYAARIEVGTQGQPRAIVTAVSVTQDTPGGFFGNAGYMRVGSTRQNVSSCSRVAERQTFPQPNDSLITQNPNPELGVRVDDAATLKVMTNAASIQFTAWSYGLVALGDPADFLTVVVYVDGAVWDEVTGQVTADGKLFLFSIALPGDGNQHLVELVGGFAQSQGTPGNNWPAFSPEGCFFQALYAPQGSTTTIVPQSAGQTRLVIYGTSILTGVFGNPFNVNGAFALVRYGLMGVKKFPGEVCCDAQGQWTLFQDYAPINNAIVGVGPLIGEYKRNPPTYFWDGIGSNDWAYGPGWSSLGLGSGINAFTIAHGQLLDGLIGAFPNIKIFVELPLPRAGETNANTDGFTLPQLRAAKAANAAARAAYCTVVPYGSVASPGFWYGTTPVIYPPAANNDYEEQIQPVHLNQVGNLQYARSMQSYIGY